MAKTILIADDDATIVNLFHLDNEGRNGDAVIRSAVNGEDTIQMLQTSVPDVLVLDIRMPKGDGFTVLEHMHKHKINIPVVILTNYSNADYVKKSKTYGNVREYLVKHEVTMSTIMRTVSAHV